jgi:hypothetical protein
MKYTQDFDLFDFLHKMASMIAYAPVFYPGASHEEETQTSDNSAEYYDLFNGNVIDAEGLENIWAQSGATPDILECARHLANPLPTVEYNKGGYTLHEVVTSMGLRGRDKDGHWFNHMPEPIAIKLGAFINYFLPDRVYEMTSVTVGRKTMRVKLYNAPERELQEHLVKIFFGRLDLIATRHLTLYYFNVVELIEGMVASSDYSEEVKATLTGFFLGASPYVEDNIESFTDILRGNLPEESVTEDGMVDACWRLHAERIALQAAWMVSPPVCDAV